MLALFLWAAIVCCGFATDVHSQEREEEPLVVGLYHAPPFAIKQGADTWDGLALTLWRQVAEEMGVLYELQEILPENMEQAVATHAVDLALIAVASAEGEQQLDFSQSYYSTQLAAARRQDNSVLATLDAIFTRRFLTTALSIGVLLLLVGLLMWVLERNENAEQFGDRWHSGAWAGFWWAAVTLTSIGYGDKVPQTVPGRLLALFWMLLAIGITATLTATITSIIAFGPSSRSLEYPRSLRQQTVGAVADSAPVTQLDEERISYRAYPSLDEGLDALIRQEIDIFVHDTASLRYAGNERKELFLDIQGFEVLPQYYAFAVPDGSPLREEINRIVLNKITDPGWSQIVARYLP